MIFEEKVLTLHEVSEYLKVHPSTFTVTLSRGLFQRSRWEAIGGSISNRSIGGG